MSDVTFPDLAISNLPVVSAGPPRAPVDPVFSDVHHQYSAVPPGMSIGSSFQRPPVAGPSDVHSYRLFPSDVVRMQDNVRGQSGYVPPSAAGHANPGTGAGNLSGMSGAPIFPGPSAGAGSIGLPPSSMQGTTFGQPSAFQVVMKPREPPTFAGKVSEDIELWLYTVRAYFRTVAAPEEQKVGYTLTMLQDAAREWWTQWVRQRGGIEPATFEELAAALTTRFVNRSKEQVARVELRTIRQLKNENARTYAARFNRLLGHLLNYDDVWALDQFTSGLVPKVAELLLLKAPT